MKIMKERKTRRVLAERKPSTWRTKRREGREEGRKRETEEKRRKEMMEKKQTERERGRREEKKSSAPCVFSMTAERVRCARFCVYTYWEEEGEEREREKKVLHHCGCNATDTN